MKQASVLVLSLAGLSVVPVSAALGACSSQDAGAPPADAGGHDGTLADSQADSPGPADGGDEAQDATAPDGAPVPDAGADVGLPPAGSFCLFPGSVLSTASGQTVVPGGTGPDLTWLHVPAGFCVHYFGRVLDARQLKFAPGGDLFVASPTRGTTGGVPTGALGGIAVLPDDNHDGVADTNLTFLQGVDAIQGLLFTNGLLYYQAASTIRSVAFRPGDRTPSATPQDVTTFTPQIAEQGSAHWPKVMDVTMGGKIYITNGGENDDPCLSTAPVTGAIFELQPDGGVSLVSRGFRNPIALKCQTNHDVCLAVELALDYSNDKMGREKIVPVQQGADWGFPCCATKDTPYSGATYGDTQGVPDCSGVSAESESFIIGDTPFGIDFETGKWPAPWGGRGYVTLHGVVGSFVGARVVSIDLDPATGLPLPGTDLPGLTPGTMLDFATGWDNAMQAHGRPAPIAFAPDGRMFLGDDNTGLIVWVAPFALPAR